MKFPHPWGGWPPSGRADTALLLSEEGSLAAWPQPIPGMRHALHPSHQCAWGPCYTSIAVHRGEGRPFTREEGSPLFGKTSEERGNNASGRLGGSVD